MSLSPVSSSYEDIGGITEGKNRKRESRKEGSKGFLPESCENRTKIEDRLIVCNLVLVNCS